MGCLGLYDKIAIEIDWQTPDTKLNYRDKVFEPDVLVYTDGLKKDGKIRG